ncbi:MAG: GDP-mannose 4,6-dehydratase [Spirochaetes bacterium]|nr:GDP-mannose 4,6-dehydratase [Spirochaetota bacterium]
MEKYIITGFSGFVARHFLEYLENNKINANILGIDIVPFNIKNNEYKHIKWNFIELDLLDKDKIQYYIYQFHPDYILHLASSSSVAYSWQNPVISFQNNINIYLNLLEVIRLSNIKCRVLSIGSSEQYGNINQTHLPLKEDYLLEPLSPYAVARVSQEQLSKVYANSFGLDIVMTRSFNHIGPGQKDNFVISSFAKQLVQVKKKLKNDIEVGDLSIIRDFLDVRDVVSAYYKLLQKGISGNVYNVCSGKGYSLKEMIEKMMGILKINVKLKKNPNLIRPNDNKIIIGSNQKIKDETMWNISYSIDMTLHDIINEYLDIIK